MYQTPGIISFYYQQDWPAQEGSQHLPAVDLGPLVPRGLPATQNKDTASVLSLLWFLLSREHGKPS